MVEIRDESGNRLDLSDIKKMADDERVNRIFVYVNDREGVILPKKQGKRWWKKAKIDDILRIIVY